jgi:hypothetical protein
MQSSGQLHVPAAFPVEECESCEGQNEPEFGINIKFIESMNKARKH